MPARRASKAKTMRAWRRLRKALRSPGRGVGALVGIEGPKLIEEALRAGLRVKTVFVAQGSDRASDRILEKLSLPRETEILHLPKKLLDQALATETPQSIAALIEPPQWSWEQLLGSRRNSVALVIVLAGLQDPGNLGTILRSAEAFGATGVVSLPGTVSAWNTKAVRASAGSVFRVPLLAAEIDKCIPRLHSAGLAIFAALSQGAQLSHSADLARPVALIIGNEGNGVPGALAARADSTITIPCPGPVESLNAAVAASVLLYEASRGNVQSAFGTASKNRGARR